MKWKSQCISFSSDWILFMLLLTFRDSCWTYKSIIVDTGQFRLWEFNEPKIIQAEKRTTCDASLHDNHFDNITTSSYFGFLTSSNFVTRLFLWDCYNKQVIKGYCHLYTPLPPCCGSVVRSMMYLSSAPILGLTSGFVVSCVWCSWAMSVLTTNEIVVETLLQNLIFWFPISALFLVLVFFLRKHTKALWGMWIREFASDDRRLQFQRSMLLCW